MVLLTQMVVCIIVLGILLLYYRYINIPRYNISKSIDTMINIIGPNDKRWDVIAKTMKIFENGFASEKMINTMSRCYNPEYMSEKEKSIKILNDIMYGKL